MAKKAQTKKTSAKQTDKTSEKSSAATLQEEIRKKQIRSRISGKESQINSLNGQLTRLGTEKVRMTESLQKWKQAESSYRRNPLSMQREVKGVFEGRAACEMNVQTGEHIMSMNSKASASAGIKERISSQESRISVKLGSLNAQISTLRGQL